MISRGGGRRGNGRGSSERAEEDRQEAGLEQLDLPAEAVPVLSDVDERHVQRPQDGHEHSVGEPQQHGNREGDTDPRSCLEHPVGDVQPEEAGHLEEGGSPRSRPRGDVVEEERDREQASRSEQREELLGETQERDEVDEPEEPEDDEAGEPVARRLVSAAGGFDGARRVATLAAAAASVNEPARDRGPVCQEPQPGATGYDNRRIRDATGVEGELLTRVARPRAAAWR